MYKVVMRTAQYNTHCIVQLAAHITHSDLKDIELLDMLHCDSSAAMLTYGHDTF